MEGQIFIEGEINPELTANVKRQLANNSLAQSFAIHISSPGGSVYDGYKIFHAIKDAANNPDGSKKPIRAVIEGEAQSMATFIACVADKGAIEIANPSIYMIHNPSQQVGGDAESLRSGAEELTMIENEMAQVYADRTGLPIDEVKIMMKKETRMTASKAVQLKFADKISTHLRAVAHGKIMTKKKNPVSVIAEALKEAFGGNEPTAIDLPLQDGTVLTSDAQNEDTINGSSVMISGAVAPDGDYTTTTGMVITVKGGKVVNVVDPTDAKGETPEQKAARLEAELNALKAKQAAPPAQVAETAEQKAARLEAEIAAMKAEKEAAAADEKKAIAEALAEVEKLKKKTIGNAAPPAQGTTPMRTPIGFKPSGPNALGLDATRTFIANDPSMAWLKQRYPVGYFNNYEWGGPQATSIVETNFPFTYPGILTDELLFKPTLSSPALSDLFTIDQGISFQKQYNVIPGLSKILKPYTGCGASNSNGNRVQIGTATLSTKEFRMQEKWCKDDFTQQLTGIYNNLAQDWLKTGEKSFDPANTPMDSVIMDVLVDALRRDVFIRATMAAGNSSSADFNQIDGLWDRLIDSSGQSNYCVVRANSSLYGGSALGTGTLAAGIALTNLELVYSKSNDLLKEQFDRAAFWVTGSVYDNYVQSLVGNGQVSANQFINLTEGTGGKTTWGGGIKYKGIPIYPVRLWDSSLADSNNPLNATTRHLILLTVKQNHYLGLENGADLNNIFSWYENKDSARYYRSDMKMGYQYMHCDLQTIAY